MDKQIQKLRSFDIHTRKRLLFTVLILIITTFFLVAGFTIVNIEVSKTLYDNTLNIKRDYFKDSVEALKNEITTIMKSPLPQNRGDLQRIFGENL